MIDNQRLHLWIINDRRCRATALVHDDDILWLLRFHRRSLHFIVDVGAFADEVDIDERFFQPKCRERPVDNDASIEAVGIFIGDYQGLLFCCSAR